MTNEKLSHSRYLELDSLRGFAALLVVLFHFTMGKEQAKIGFNVGITGVDLFFIISGFVIFMSVNKVSSTREFIINRFTRLYPTYWTCVTFTFLLTLIVNKYFGKSVDIPFLNYLANLTMFQQYFKIPDIDGAYWTMIIEMQFYIIIGIVLYFNKLKYIIPIGLVLIGTVIMQYFLVGTKLWPAYIEFRSLLHLLNHFPLFFSGIIFYKISTGSVNKIKYYIIILCLLLFQIYSLEDDTFFISRKEHIVMTTIYFSLFILFINKKLKFIISKLSLFLGKISFALYLIHQYISTQVLLPLLLDTYHLNFWIASLIALIIIIALASIITYYVEIPIGKRMNNAFRGAFKLQMRS